MPSPVFPPSIPIREYVQSQKAIIGHMLNAYKGYQERYGDLFKAYLVVRPVLVATAPSYATHVLQKNHRNYYKDGPSHTVGEVIGNGILTSEGDYWRKQRRIVQPAFHKTQIVNLSRIMAEETDLILRGLEDHDELEAHQLMTNLALKVVTRALFSRGISDDEIGMVDECVTVLLELMVMKIREPFRVLKYKITGKLDEYWAKRRELDALIYGIIDQRKAEGAGDNDLLDMLLTSTDGETGEPLKREEILQELMALFLAGHETSANGLAWTLMLLDQHPEVLETLQQEVDTVLRGEAVSFDHMNQLTYTRQVIDESLRLYPPAWIIGREALGPDEVGDLKLKKGDNISVFIYGLHRNPNYWEAPDEFRPERMEAAKKKKFLPHQYLPFGGGPRLCIGHQFAVTEMQIALATLVQRYTFTRLDQTPVSLIPSITLRPGDPLRFRFEKRGA